MQYRKAFSSFFFFQSLFYCAATKSQATPKLNHSQGNIISTVLIEQSPLGISQKMHTAVQLLFTSLQTKVLDSSRTIKNTKL